MVKLLSKIFIKNAENTADPAVRRAYGSLCGALGIALNLLLFAGKYLAGVLSGSIAVTADAFNNLSDAGSSVITLVGFKLSGKRPDAEHPFGHGKLEYISGLAVAGLILIMGFELLTSSVSQILDPQPVKTGLLATAILAGSVLVKLYMFAYNRSIGKKIGSSAMLASSADSLSDSAATAVVLLSMGAAHFADINIDGWAGLLVACFILFSGIKAAGDTISPLLGQAPAPEFVEQVKRTVLAYPEILDIHDLIVHDYGPGRCIISLHAEVNGRGDIFALHDAIDSAERQLADELGCLATIHMDPVETDNGAVSEKRRELERVLSELPEIQNIHDFRMVSGPSHTNLIFDVVLPPQCEKSDAQIRARVCELVEGSMPGHFAVVNVDRAYTEAR